MKKLTAILLLLSLCLCLAGCSFFQKGDQETVLFYYQRVKYLYGQENSVIASEERDGAGHISDPKYLLQLYLLGPHDEELVSPFPEGLKITKVETVDDTVTIYLNGNLSTLADAKRSLACACLTLTCLDITGKNYVSIVWEDGSITMDRSCLMLFDGVTADPTE